MRWIILGALLGLLLVLWPASLPLAATTLAHLVAQPAVLAFVLGALARPAITRRWTA
ncbi:hypothetical protein ACFC08_35620 [Streptomyces sp. NPDC056112]|uniref:hypothetical protein n=1 Tax=Streptomyces sp. NPDC056112 TaxID=3345715 RepID=UPI0035DE5A8D